MSIDIKKEIRLGHIFVCPARGQRLQTIARGQAKAAPRTGRRLHVLVVCRKDVFQALRNALLGCPHTGHVQSSGRASKSPSYTYPHTEHTRLPAGAGVSAW